MPFRIIALLCLLSGAALAAEVETPAPEVAASEAADIVDKHCSDVASSGTSHAAAAFTEVSPVWARVSRSYDQHKTLFLLYWRGVLSQCLNQEERAQEDLVAFIAAAEGDSTMASQVSDSRRRLRHLSYRGDAVA